MDNKTLILNIINKYGKPILKALLISSVVSFTFKWLWDLETKMIHLERDIYYNLPEHNDKPNLR
jgi:hypothetical protein